MVRTVHRFQDKFLFLPIYTEELIPEFRSMTGRLIEMLFRDMRRPDSKISFIPVETPEIVLDLSPHDHPVWLQKRES